ncbi:tetratricopeptide repeat protein [Hankyongella ginsenosidimutans]|uniref:tetratricopeptide repeat protein n=1 Tax=Hankyongella ginsenosidimutans TaxID=1763828 RepID=UPI001FE3D503|nr:tetratricopeptide repeat protein [Hankyongella ginsenosidimutans]
MPDAQAAPMQAAIRAMATRDFETARRTCDMLVEQYPLWSEAWNKRATLAYLEDRDPDSIADIQRTLELEPRHFGALSGLGQICLRQGEPDIARLAFAAALHVNPHMGPSRPCSRSCRHRRCSRIDSSFDAGGHPEMRRTGAIKPRQPRSAQYTGKHGQQEDAYGAGLECLG